MNVVRALMSLGLVPSAILFTACSGPGSQSLPAASSQAAATRAGSGSQSAIKTATPTSGEQLNVLTVVFDSSIPTYDNPQVTRFRFGNPTPTAVIHPPTRDTYGLAVSADDQDLFLPYGTSSTVGFDMYGPGGTWKSVNVPEQYPYSPSILESQDNSTIALTWGDANNATHVMTFRSPFTQPFQQASTTLQPNGIAGPYQLLNRSGSEALRLTQGEFYYTFIDALSIPGGQESYVNYDNSKIDAQSSLAYDGNHDYWYLLGTAYQNSNGSAPLNEVLIFNMRTDAYLGYINLPAFTHFEGAAVNQQSSDLYVVLDQHVYVYNVPSCGCTRIKRQFSSAVPNPSSVAVDAANQHLLLWSPFTPSGETTYDHEIIDENPMTGAVQGTYTIPGSGNIAIATVIAH